MAEIILGILLGMLLAGIMVYLYIRGLVRTVMRELDEHIERAANTLMPVIIERENGVLFCYDKQDKQFICQGTTVADIREAFARRYPDKTAYLDGGDEELVKELREELKELNVKLD
jgi:hypothetical protein